MFCPSCGKQNQDNVLFCAHCGKALPQQSVSSPKFQQSPPASQSPRKVSIQKVRISDTAIKAVITGILIVVLILVVFLIYYPGVFPWNW
jgi:uncharacterized membrane protein YvbJ